ALVYNAYLHERSRECVAELNRALEVRPQIDRAVGIMMSRTAKTPEQALDTLRKMSNAHQVKVSVLAGDVVDEGVRRARQRRAGHLEEASSLAPHKHL